MIILQINWFAQRVHNIFLIVNLVHGQFRNKKQYENKCMANTDDWIHQSSDQVLRSSKQPLFTGHTRHEQIV